MPLSSHRNELRTLLAACESRAGSIPGLTDSGVVLLRQSLRHLADHAEDFDDCLPEDNPFYEEFTGILLLCRSPGLDWFSLFECIAIFFRLRQCRHVGCVPCQAERALLRHFEQCGEWRPDDGTLVSEWYWRRIPEADRTGGSGLIQG